MSRTKRADSQELWDRAIEDAKTLLCRIKERAIRLQVAIEELQRSKEFGEPWPGTAKPLHGQLVGQLEKQQHSE